MKQIKKQRVFHCKRIKNGEEGYREGFDLYRAPIEKRLSVRPVSSDALFVTGGELSQGSLIVKMPVSQNDFSENDRCYVYAAPPEHHDKLCKAADYRVVSVSASQQIAEIVLERTVQNARI